MKVGYILSTVMILTAIIFAVNGCGGGGGGGDKTENVITPTGSDIPSGNIVKDLFVNVDSSDPLVMTAVDANDRYYSFFGFKDEENLLINFEQLVLDQLNESDELEHYLTIDLDEHQRPIAYSFNDSGDQLILEYISDYIVYVTYLPVDGASETVVVDNPFPLMDESTSNSEVYYSLSRSLSYDEQWNYQGNIKTCRDGNIPKVTIKRQLSTTIRKAFPALRLVFSQNAKEAYNPSPGDADFYYYFSVIIMDGFYEKWETKCKAECNKIGIGGYLRDKLLGIVSKSKETEILLEQAKKNADAAGKLKPAIEDIKGRMTLGIPIVDFINGIKNVWRERTCSKENYTIYREIVKNKLTVSCTYKGVTKQSEYIPGTPDKDNWETDPKLDFDFSNKCQKSSLWPNFPNPEYCNMKGEGYIFIDTNGVPDDSTYIDCAYFDNGQLGFEYPYVDGRPNGIAKEYYENGMLRIAGQYIDGMREGKWEKYSDTGNLSGCYMYENNQIIGPLGPCT